MVCQKLMVTGFEGSNSSSVTVVLDSMGVDSMGAVALVSSFGSEEFEGVGSADGVPPQEAKRAMLATARTNGIFLWDIGFSFVRCARYPYGTF